MLDHTEQIEAVVINGINVTEFDDTVQAVRDAPELAKFQFRATNAWDDGGYNRSTIRGFYGAGEEHGAEDRSFVVGADEPPVLLGEDRAPNPVEYLLHALAGCLTSTIVYKAASQGIHVESIESFLTGDLDARAFLELSQEERKGYQSIQVNFKVKSDAPSEKIRELMEFSPVLDVMTNGTQVSIVFENT